MHHAAPIAALEKMENTIATPLARAAVASAAGITPRHLDRLFAVHLGTTFSAHYRRLRLDHARNLLRQSALSATEIAMACGFSGGAFRQALQGRSSASRRRRSGCASGQ